MTSKCGRIRCGQIKGGQIKCGADTPVREKPRSGNEFWDKKATR